jgi:hypothetical protein
MLFVGCLTISIISHSVTSQIGNRKQKIHHLAKKETKTSFAQLDCRWFLQILCEWGILMGSFLYPATSIELGF